MGRMLDRPGFEEWRAWVFDHPAAGPEWYFDPEADWWDGATDPERAVRYLTQLFESPIELLEGFSDAQVGRGLWFLASAGCSDLMFALLDPSVTWAQRERGIWSIYHLHRKLFAARCTENYGHLDAGPEPPSPLNLLCYMWWDVCPVPYAEDPRERRRTGAVTLEVLRDTLRLPSPACQEGALHGLGHLQTEYRAEVRAIIDAYLKGSAVPVPLRPYARSARSGCVL
jgi:hypothetical protein